MKKRRSVSYETKKKNSGYIFISLWLTGFTLLFLIPFITSVVYSFNNVEIDVGRLILKPVGFDNYREIFMGDAGFLPSFWATLTSMVKVPFIVMLSLFIALLLNQNFHGKTLARAVFFLPVIIMSGPVMTILNTDTFFAAVLGSERASTLVEFASAQELLKTAGLDNVVSSYIVNMTSQLFTLVWSSGIQILIFISGLQAVPRSHYEVAAVEGATSWEKFWKITFPSVAPMMLVNIIYTMVDLLLGDSSPIYSKIQSTIAQVDYAYASAMSLVCFAVWAALVLAVYGLINRYVHYTVE